MRSIKELQKEINDAYNRLSIGEHTNELKALHKQALHPDFWQDNLVAQEVSKKIAKLEAQTVPWQDLKHEVDELVELGDLKEDISEPQANVESVFQQLKEQLKYTGRYDDYDAILSIYAGAGGTDAQDWAEMLLRMYTRWAEKNNVKVQLLDESRGDEAGIKSVNIALSGAPYVYGQLKSEHGVHRLVRLSPFNSDNLRQTSFAKVEIIPSIDQPGDVEINDNDLKIDTYRSSGNGGQSVNTTDSAVRITHVPTNIVVAIQNEKSQLQNKETAMKILRSRLAQLKIEQHAERISDLKGPAQANEWGSQIRNYVLHPYKLVKDVRTGQESSSPDDVLDGDLNSFIAAYLEQQLSI